MRQNLAEQIVQWDNEIRSGHKLAVRKGLAQVKLAKVPRSDALALANIARRVNLPLLALRILVPIVRPSRPKEGPRATPEELALYAAVLIKLGACDEAQSLLDDVIHKTPDALLYRGFALLSQWNYAGAVPWFRKYLSSRDITDYQRALGQLNLAATYVYIRNHEAAETLLQDLKLASQQSGWTLIYGNVLELSASAATAKGDWQAARILIQEAMTRLPESHIDRVQLRKLQVVADLKSKGVTPESEQELAKVRQDAEANELWEVVRDCDFHSGVTRRDENLLSRVYFGTPYASYRQRVLAESEEWFTPDPTFLWKVGETPSDRTFDLISGQEQTGRVRLERGGVLHRLFSILTSDFYRPQMMGAIFATLYPGEQFNPDSSPARVARLVTRLREWLSQNQIPIQVVVQKGLLSLLPTTGYNILITAERPLEQRRNVILLDAIRKLKEAYPHRAFSSSQAASALGVSSRSVNDYVSWAISENKLYRSGQGRATRYRFAK